MRKISFDVFIEECPKRRKKLKVVFQVKNSVKHFALPTNLDILEPYFYC